MTRVFVFTNYKRGVGKSTSATNIAFGITGMLHRANASNCRVLLINTDSQGHASLVTTGRKDYGPDNSLYTVLMADRQNAPQTLMNCIVPSTWDESVTAYTFTDGTQTQLALVETRVPDKKRRKRRKWLAFVLVKLSWTPHQVYQKYRRRFGIECSYRLLRQVKVLTNSRNPALRFFLLGLGLVLLRWLYTRRPSKGRYKLIPTLLRFNRFRKLLIRAIELLFPPVRTVLVYALPNS